MIVRVTLHNIQTEIDVPISLWFVSGAEQLDNGTENPPPSERGDIETIEPGQDDVPQEIPSATGMFHPQHM